MPTPGEHKTVQARILEYAGGPDQAGFEESAITYDATLRNLELIEEVAKLSTVDADTTDAR